MSFIEPYSSRRFPLAVDVYSANPAYSVSQNEFKSTIQGTIRHPDRDPFANDHKYYLLVEPLLRVQANTKTRDLVERLIRDEHVLWQALLNNRFCQKMRTASSGDVSVTNGFKWYMIVRIPDAVYASFT
jgi:hypothetical protein